MAKVVEATGDGACLFNAVSIGLGIEILSGRLDDHKDSPGYLRLLDVFAEHHPQFNPKSWNNLKQWLLYYNNSRDWELILAPVLFKLNQKYQAKLENEVLNELANFIRDNKANIEDQQPIYLLNFNKCPKIDNLTLQAKRELLASILPIIKDWDQNQDFIVFRQLVSTRAQVPLNNLIDLIKADQNAFQMGYGCHDLKGMVDSLHLTLVENQTGSYLTDMNTKIYLRNREQHWDVVVSDDDFSRLSFGVQQLSMASLDAFHGLKQVTSPMQEHSSEHSELTEASVSPPQNLTAQAIETPVEAKQGNDSSTAATDNDEARLKHLKEVISATTNTYTQYTKANCFFSFFHRHGSIGRARASRFNTEFTNIADYAEAKNRLVDFLMDGKNGNSYAHSFRTMLLNSLQGSTDQSSLNETSTKFAAKLEQLITELSTSGDTVSNRR